MATSIILNGTSGLKLHKKPVYTTPANWTEEEFKDGIMKIEGRIKEDPKSLKGYEGEVGCKYGPLKHTFTDKQYIRQITMITGSLWTSQIHKIKHPFFVMQGECTVLSELGVSRIRAPYWGVTEPGTKRLLYIHEETVWITVHPTKKKDVNSVVDEVIAKDYDDFENFKALNSINKIKLGEGE